MSHHDRAESSARLVAHLQPTIHKPALPPPRSSSSSHRMLARTGVVTHYCCCRCCPPQATTQHNSGVWQRLRHVRCLVPINAASLQRPAHSGWDPQQAGYSALVAPCSTRPCCWPRPAMPPYSGSPQREHPTSWCPPQPPTQLTMLKGLLAATCSFRPRR